MSELEQIEKVIDLAGELKGNDPEEMTTILLGCAMSIAVERLTRDQFHQLVDAGWSAWEMSKKVLS